MRPPRALAPVAALALVAGLGGCAGGVPDSRLLEEIAAIEGVTDVDIRYEDPVMTGPMYTGGLKLSEDADAACVLDRAFAILWQGRKASLHVGVLQGGDDLTSDELFGVSGIANEEELARRYGPRPATRTFVTPEDPPACR